MFFKVQKEFFFVLLCSNSFLVKGDFEFCADFLTWLCVEVCNGFGADHKTGFFYWHANCIFLGRLFLVWSTIMTIDKFLAFLM